MRWLDLLFAHWPVDANSLQRLIPAGLELDVKTPGGKAGVWFFSLDAGQRLAVRVARRFFHLPYFDARFAIECSEGVVDYSSVRTHRGAAGAAFSARYSAAGPVYSAVEGSLDHWLTERYCLYSADREGRIYRGDIEHRPWPLQQASAEIRVNSLGEWLGIELAGVPETLHFVRSLDVRAWAIARVG